MKIEKYFVSMVMAAAMMLAVACSSDNNETSPDQPEIIATKTIPYSVTVSNGGFTRASLNNTKAAYIFEKGDKLYVTNSDGTVYGTLTLKDDDEGKSTDATFSGTISYTGAAPTASLVLTAVLKSSTDAIVTLDSDNKVTDFSYPSTAVASSIEEAIRKYSKFTATSTYGDKSFSLEQGSTFLSFSITLKDGTANGSNLSVSISNNNSEVRTGSITTSTVDGEVKAQFVAAFLGSTQLNNATVTLGLKNPISFGGSTTLAANNIYRVTKGLIDLYSFNTGQYSYTAKKGDVLTGTPNENFMISIEDKATVTLSGVDAGTNTLTITCEGDATVVLAAGTTNTLKGNTHYPGLEIGPSGKTLTIKGSGSLSSTGGYGAAGIGTKYLGVISTTGDVTYDYGNVSIESGTITATGGTDAAGIGTGVSSVTGKSLHAVNRCGSIVVSGGIVTSNGNGYGAGIGTGIAKTSGGEGATSTNSCGSINISCAFTVNKGSNAPYEVGKGGIGSSDTPTSAIQNVTSIKINGTDYPDGYNHQ